MCGIAALLSSPATPPAPAWPFWAGGTPSRPSPATRPLSPADVQPLLTRRGPDATLRHTTRIPSPACTATLHLTQTVLSHRGSPPSSLATPSGNVLLFNGEVYAGLPVAAAGSDMAALAVLLETFCAGGRPLAEDALAALDGLRGPWALVFWHAETRRLYFGRDALGRRSLQLRVVPGQSLELLSVPPRGSCERFVEVPPIGLGFVEVRGDGEMCFGLVERESHCVAPRRVLGCADGELVAGSVRDMYVSFLPSSWLRSCGESRKEIGMTLEESAEGFLNCFRRSMRRRLVTNRRFYPGCPRFAVLFSGGIDSLVIAAVLDELLPPDEGIQLINVAFGKDSSALEQCPDRANAITGLAELQNVSQTERRFDLCFVDVSPENADDALALSVRHLLHPCDQPMDASIGTAIWLAAKADGSSCGQICGPTSSRQMKNDCNGANEHPPPAARVLFSGLGADELMGGYKGRHRTIFRHEGVEGIEREMDADLSRLWFRNLGRDDRLVADHGREVRQPYLDEDLISLVTSLPLVEHVCDLSKPDGVGDKHLLRRAASLLGFSMEVISRAKRAIQFGSRSKQVIERKRPP